MVLIVLILSSAFSGCIPEKRSQTVTRIQWVGMLIDSLDYEKSTSEEGYFDDVEAENFTMAQTAAEYGLFDINEPDCRPLEPATREFVAVTAAVVLGLGGEPEASFSDLSSHPNENRICLAVDYGLVSGHNKTFNPSKATTLPECKQAITKIEELLAPLKTNEENTFVKLRPELVDLNHAADASSIQFFDEEAMRLNVSSEAASKLKEGSVYLLPPTRKYPEGIARKVKSITISGDTAEIQNEIPSLDEVIEDFHVEGEFYPDFSNAEWADGVAVESTTENSETPAIAPMSLTNITKGTPGSKIKLKLNLNDNGMKITGSTELEFKVIIKDFKPQLFPPRIKNAKIVIETKTKSEIKAEIVSGKAKGHQIDSSLGFVTLVIAPGMSFLVEIGINISGEITFTYSDVKINQNVLEIKNNKLKTYNKGSSETSEASLEGTVKVAFEVLPSLRLLSISMIKGNLSIGAALKGKNILETDCNEISLYAFLEIGIAIIPDTPVEISWKLSIWDEKNSPITAKLHFEDGRVKTKCTRKKQGNEVEPSSDSNDMNDSSNRPSSSTIDYTSYLGKSASLVIDEVGPHYVIGDSGVHHGMQNDVLYYVDAHVGFYVGAIDVEEAIDEIKNREVSSITFWGDAVINEFLRASMTYEELKAALQGKAEIEAPVEMQLDDGYMVDFILDEFYYQYLFSSLEESSFEATVRQPYN